VQRRNRLSGWDERLIDSLLDFLSRTSRPAEGSPSERVKFVGYYDLLELLKTPGCPVCSIIRRSSLHYLNTMFVQQLNSMEFREPVRESMGYCSKHSELVRGIARRTLPRMGITVVYQEILETAEWKLKHETEVPLPSNCHLCSLESDLEEYAVRLIADHLGDEEFQRRFLASEGVCLPHMRLIGTQLQGSRAKFFLSAERQILDRLLSELHEFVCKHDHRFSRQEFSAAEASSWKRAVHFFVGA